MANSTAGEYRGFKKMKIWKDKKTGHKCMMLFATTFVGIINNGPPHWAWDCYEETSDDKTLVAKLLKVCWLEVIVCFDMSELSELSAGIDYEIAYKVKLTAQATGWELPVTLDLKFPNDTKVFRRQYSLFEKPREEWIYLVGGEFKLNKGETGGVRFDLTGRGGWWKTGLIIQGIIIRPKT